MLYWSSRCCIYCTPLWIWHGRVFKMEFFFYRQLIPSLRLYMSTGNSASVTARKLPKFFPKVKGCLKPHFRKPKIQENFSVRNFFLPEFRYPVHLFRYIAWKKILAENRTHNFYVNMHLLHFFTVMNGQNKCLVGFLKFAENALTSCNSLENEWIWVDDAGTGRGGGEAGGPSCWILSRVVSK